jgi:ABC-type branched-subunit amino acid transport system permease subunit
MAAIRRGRLGRLLRGLADATVALDSHGVNSNITKLVVFCIAAFFAGIAGAVLAPITGSVTAQPFEFFVSLLLVAVLFLAGRQPVLGAMAAAVMYIVIPGYVTDVKLLDYLPVIFGAGAVLVGVVGGAPLLDSLTPTRRTLKRVGRPALPVRTLRRAEVVS